nr:probable polygalacturonase [Tanacetum cinerariifolium]
MLQTGNKQHMPTPSKDEREYHMLIELPPSYGHGRDGLGEWFSSLIDGSHLTDALIRGPISYSGPTLLIALERDRISESRRMLQTGNKQHMPTPSKDEREYHMLIELPPSYGHGRDGLGEWFNSLIGGSHLTDALIR